MSAVEVCSSRRDNRKSATASTAVPTIGQTLYRPVPAMRWPLAIDATSRPPTIGTREAPDSVAAPPRAPRRERGRAGAAPQVEVERPPPGEIVDEEPADQRADDAGDPEHGAERALVLPPLARRDDVTHDRLGEHYEAAAADALDRAERDQLAHVLGQTGQRRANQEDDDGGDEQVFPAVLVAELAPHRGGGG